MRSRVLAIDRAQRTSAMPLERLGREGGVGAAAEREVQLGRPPSERLRRCAASMRLLPGRTARGAAEVSRRAAWPATASAARAATRS